MRNFNHINAIKPTYTNEHLDQVLNKEKEIGTFLKNKVEKRSISPQIIKKIKNKIKLTTY